MANGKFRVGNTSYYEPTGIVTMYPGSQMTLDDSAQSPSAFILANCDAGSATPSEPLTSMAER